MNDVIKPKFLSDVKITKKDKEQLPPLMSNWVVLSHNISTLDEENLMKMMILELNDRRRMQIIQRLKSRFNTLRMRRENHELTTLRTT